MQSAGELQASLRDYGEQLEEVRGLLAEEPGNSGLVEMQNSLLEVIALTEDLLRSAGGGAAGTAPPPPSHVSRFSSAPPSGAMPPSGVMRTNWAPGESCQALFTDGAWHNATVESAAPGGGFKVLFDHYAVPVTLPASSLRPPLLGGAEAVYVGVPAPKRLRVDESFRLAEIPKKLEILPTDDERTKEKKRKLVKTLKSKQRLAEAEAQQTERAQSWQAFRSGKAAKHKTGFLTNVKKAGSMWGVEEGGRVGVTGSGKAPAPTHAPTRHEHAKEEGETDA